MDKLKLISVQKTLSLRKISIFSTKDFARTFNVDPKTARAFLSYNTKTGAFRRLKRGAYCLASELLAKFEIANYLHQPSYISFETAMSYYGLIPETVYTIISATTKAPKTFEFENQSYQYIKIKKNFFFGYSPVKIRDKTIRMADKEKALLDYLYLASLKKLPINERLNLNKLDKKQLDFYVNFFKKHLRKNKAFLDLVKNLKYDFS
ncbi:hypothetical protein KKB69_00380 [Patescibacteria group bacterium]|nr:hypothetical protein [Patescibacteria group bacterium]